MTDPVDLKDYTCPVCLEMYEKPRRISCNHVLCKECVKQYESQPHPSCPVCRSSFNPKMRHAEHQIETDMRQLTAACPMCSQQMILIYMRAHSAVCGATAKIVHKFKPVAHTSQPIPRDVKNRSTFKCPYCSEMNLDTQGLREHCNKYHPGSREHVVCPICASMPWGNKDQTSGNFLQHLNLRHKFEYETYVDFEQDDDVMLQQALQDSLFNN